MATLSERIAALTAEQRQLLLQRLQAAGTQYSREGTIPRQSKRGVFPLSFAQQRLWFLDAYHQGSPFYNFSLEYKILGKLNQEALMASVREIVRRHETFRTVFVIEGEQPLQVVRPAGECPIEVRDLQNLPLPARQDEAERLIQNASRCVFDLARGPLFRVLLLQLGPTEHIFQLVAHHIIFDGWSIRLFVHELEVLYAALSENRSPSLPDLHLQYGDFSVWQREQLQGEKLKGLLEFWKQALAGLRPYEIATDHPRPAQQTYHGAVQPFALSAADSQILVQWSRRHGATLFMTLLAAFSYLLRSRSGQTDIPIGSVVANRNHFEIEPLIGFFVNTLVFRMDVTGDPTFLELVHCARDTVLPAQAHQDLPFEKLVEELQPVRDPKRNPLVQILFALQEESVVSAPALARLQVENLRFHSVSTTRFDLEFHLWATNHELEGIIVYNTDLFDQRTAARLSLHFKELLSAIAADPAVRLSDLPRMGSAERAEVIGAWGTGPHILPLQQCLHTLIEQQVERTPEAIAITCGDKHLTYKDLNQRANRLANYLREVGIKPEVRVGLCLKRSLDMVVAILGVLKSGGAYVPLDPAYPTERINYVLTDARVELLLTENQSKPVMTPPSGIRVVCLEQEWEQIVRYSADNSSVPMDERNLAYVIYTSGSTGQPKGVAIQHSSAAVFVRWAQQVFNQDELSGVIASTSICFDLSIYEIFVPLTVGGTVILVDNALDVARISNEEPVKLMNTVPSVMAELLRVKNLPPAIRTVNLAGEALLKPLVQQLYKQSQVQRIFNLYGPSEGTTYSAFYECLSDNREEGPVPIGRPIANSQAYVLEEDQYQLVPVGAIGELFLGGDGLARGYLDRPDLTGDRFLPNPFSSTPGARLYRTGDRVRWLGDGNLEFLGRRDHQVKIRGYRIEVGEVESALLSHPAVVNAAVIAREDGQGTKHLVAYLEADSTSVCPQPAVLREHLRTKLPEHMVPSFFVTLEKLPLTPNGKIDRQALPEPPSTDSNTKSYVPARDTFELHCVQIWEQVLNIPAIGIHDNFFELGGHSLNAFVVVSRINKVFGCDFPVSVLFQRPTIEGLSSLLRGDATEAAFSPVVPLQVRGMRPPFFCVHPAGGNVLCFVALTRSMGNEQPVYGLQSRGLVERDLVVRSLEENAADYVRAIRQIQARGPYYLGGYCIGGIFAYEMAQQLRKSGEQVAALVLIDSFAPDALSKEEFDDAQALSWFTRDLGASIGKSLSIPAGELRGLSTEKAFELVLIRAKQEEVLPKETEAADLRRYFNCYLANSVAAVTYEPAMYQGRITMLYAREEKDKYNLGPTRGWKQLIDCEMELHELPGDHATIISSPNAEVLAVKVLQVLDAAQQADGAAVIEVARSMSSTPDLLTNAAPTPDDGSGDMIHIQHTYTVERTMEAVFEFLANPDTEPNWNPWIRQVKRDPKAVLERGMAFITVYQFMGREFEMRLAIDHYQPPCEVSFHVLDGPFSARTAYSLRSENGGTSVHVDLIMYPKDFFGFIPKALLWPIFQKSIKDDCRRQKDLMEA